MTLQQTQQESASRLVGWKRISAHLGCSERTARRWEREESLPVHRQMHDAKATVYAIPAELDRWIASRNPDQPADDAKERRRAGIFQGQLALIAAAAVVGAITATSLILLRPDPTPTSAAVAPLSSDPVAVDLYERGRALWQQRGEDPNTRAIKLFQQATARDEEFAEAWAALGSAWMTLPTYSDATSVTEAYEQALLVSRRALSLDPSLAEPHTVIATIAQRNGDWLESERIYESALERDPDNATVLLWFAGHYRELGMMQESIAMTERARAIDPNSPPVLTELSMNLQAIGRVEESEDLLDYVWNDLGFTTPIVWAGQWFIHLRREDYDTALAWIDASPREDHTALLAETVRHLRSGGGPPEELAAEIRAAHSDTLPFWMAYYLLAKINAIDDALDIADAEAAKGQIDTAVVMFDSELSAPRQTDRFRDLAGRLGYIEYWREHGAPTICETEEDAPFCRAIN